MVGDGSTNLASDHHSENLPKHTGPPLLKAKEYIRSHNFEMNDDNSLKEKNGAAKKKIVAEGQTSSNLGNPCKPRGSNKVKRDRKGEGCTNEVKKKKRSLEDIYNSAAAAILLD